MPCSPKPSTTPTQTGGLDIPSIDQNHNLNQMEEQTVTHESGAKGTKVPRLDLIPYRALARLAERYELGERKYGRGNWRKGLTDRDYVLDRAAHVMNHAAKFIAKLEGHLPDDGDDDAGAIMWGGAFLCEATFALKCEQDDIEDARKRIAEATLKNCSCCSGTGKHDGFPEGCPACKGSGKSRL